MGSIPEFTAYGGNAQRVGNYNNTVKKVAESYGDNVQFADVHGCLNGMADMSSDNLHPSSAGYEKMGKFWAEVLEEYLSAGQSDVHDDPEILHSDFENGLSGWKARGNASVSASADDASDGNSSAFVSNRSADWNGIAYSLSSKRCPAGTHISVKVKVKQKTGSSVHFKVTMQYDGSSSAVYDTFIEKDVSSGEWTTLSSADYVMQEGSNPVLYIETDKDTCDFYLDEVTVMKTDGSVPLDEIAGDVNDDGKFNVADVLLFQKWLIASPDAKLVNRKAADLCEDGLLDVFDLILMKQEILSQQQNT